MNIWEDVYAKHKAGGTRSLDPLSVKNGLSGLQESAGSENLAPPSARTTDSASPEEIYYRNRPAQPFPEAQQQATKPSLEPMSPQPEPKAAPQAPPEKMKSRFIPRISQGKLTVPYPGTLARVRHSLSDCWGNILVETGQTVETVLVCGATRREGTTFTAYHLALFLSKEYNMKVLYVDTNLNHTPIPKIQNRPGLFSFVAEGKELASLIVKTEYPGFHLLPSGAGTLPKNISGNSLSREPIETLLTFCRNHFAVTVIDAQPLTTSPAMIEFAKLVDMTLLVCRYGYSRQEVSKMAIEKLQKFGVTSIGVIINDRKFPIPQTLYRLMG